MELPRGLMLPGAPELQIKQSCQDREHQSPALGARMLWERQQRSGGQGELLQSLRSSTGAKQEWSPSLQTAASWEGRESVDPGVDERESEPEVRYPLPEPFPPPPVSLGKPLPS